MTGTSMDGLDASLIAVDSDGVRLCASQSLSMPPALRDQLQQLQAGQPDDALDASAQAARSLSIATAQLVSALRAQDGRPVRAIGLHGQTLRHRPELGYSLQIAAPALLAEQTGLDVVFDFRSRDLAAGGQGAPLVPIFHREMLRTELATLPADQWLGILNLGGMANVSLFRGDGQVAGFDTGPGNALLDAWAQQTLGMPFDQDGQLAGSGQAIPALVQRLLSHPFFERQGPKSTGRDIFHLGWLHDALQSLEPGDAASSADVAASLVRLTAESVQQAMSRVTGDALHRLYVCGGGSRNPVLMKALETTLACSLVTTDDLGWPSQTVESAAFGWLAHRCLEGLPGNLPEVTGASGPRVLGAVCRA